MLKIKWGQKLILGALLGLMVIFSCAREENSAEPSNPDQPSKMVRWIDPIDGSVSWVTPPPKPEEDVSVHYDTPPLPIGGYAAIQKAVVYPEVARKAGVQGTVIVQASIDKDGKTTKAIVLKGVGDSCLDEAAVNALMAITWTPASDKGEPVSLRVAVPVVFKLKEG